VAKLRSVEGARGLAAVGVLTYHASQASESSRWVYDAASRFWLGVPLFFVLSGFLLSRPFVRSVVRQTPAPSLRRYGRARILRIFPAYWAVLTVMAFTQTHFMRSDAIAALAIAAWVDVILRRSLPFVAIALTALAVPLMADTAWINIWPGISNFFLFQVPFGPWQMLGPAWTLCIEISFYAFLPLFWFAAARWARDAPTVDGRGARLALCVSTLLPIGFTFACFSGGDGFTPGPRPIPVALPSYLDEFGVGMLLAIALELRPELSAAASRGLLAAALAIAAVANFFLFTAGPIAAVGNGSGVVFGRLMTVAFALALASVLTRNEQTVLGRVLSSRLLVAAGTISYGIYIWHGYLIGQLALRAPFWGDARVDVAALLAASVGCATLSWFIVERPALQLKDRGRRKREQVQVAVPELS
jgi:peptidoglycan/LPS O-acetylase OafA/YrhL